MLPLTRCTQALSDAEKEIEVKQQEQEAVLQQLQVCAHVSSPLLALMHLQEQQLRVKELEDLAEQQCAAVAELEGSLAAAAEEAAAQEEEQEQLLRCLDAAGNPPPPPSSLPPSSSTCTAPSITAQMARDFLMQVKLAA